MLLLLLYSLLILWLTGSVVLAIICWSDTGYPGLRPEDRLCLWLIIAFWPIVISWDLTHPAQPTGYGVDDE
jgi:hypothetical protein